MPPPPEPSAAEVWFGDSLDAVAARLDAEWCAWIEDRWREHYEALHEQRDRLAELESKGVDALSDGERWEHARLVENLRDSHAALPLYQSLVERLPESMNVNYAVGRVLLSHGDEAGIAYIEKAIDCHENALLPGAEDVVQFLRGQGREAEAEPWVERWRAQRKKLDEDEKDRSGVWFDDHYTTHRASDEALRDIVEHLASVPGVARAWLLCRKTLHFHDRAMHVLIVRRKAGWLDWLSDDREQSADLALQHELTHGPGLEGDFRILVSNHLSRKNRSRMESFEGTRVFDRRA